MLGNKPCACFLWNLHRDICILVCGLKYVMTLFFEKMVKVITHLSFYGINFMGEKEIVFTIYLWRKYQKDRKFDIFTTKLIIMLLCACMEVNSIN